MSRIPGEKRKKANEIFLVGKSRDSLPSKQFATGEKIIQYYLHLCKIMLYAALRHLACCTNSNGFTQICLEDKNHCCIMSKLVVPWMLGGYKIRDVQNSLRKEVETLLNNYKKLQSHRNRDKPTETIKRENFVTESKKVFWIGYNIEKLIEDIQQDRKRTDQAKKEDIKFLKMQIEKRTGYIGPTDTSFKKAAERASKKVCGDVSEKSDEQLVENHDELDTFVDSLSNAGDGDESDLIEFVFTNVQDKENSVLLPKDILRRTAITAAGLGLSINQHTAIISSLIALSGGNVGEYVVSKSSSLRAIDHVINSEAEKIRQYIKDLANSSHKLVSVHFDGKIVKEYTGNISLTQDRLSVLVKVNGKTELLGIPSINSGTGEQQFNAIYDLLENYSLTNQVQCICFDTTATNTGRLQGVNTRMSEKLGRPLLLLACRHHVLERHITHFCKMYPSSKSTGPDNQLFKKIKSVWNDLEKHILPLKRIETPPETWINQQQQESEQFYRDLINNKTYKKDGKSRKDYQELVELSLMVVTKEERFRFHMPGPVHHARFMAKALYYLKMYLLLDQIPGLTKENKDEISDMAMFVSIFYAQWFLRAELPAASSYQDIKALWQMKRFMEINLPGAIEVVRSMSKHDWYLSPVLVVFALADKNYPDRDKLAQKLYSTHLDRPNVFKLDRIEVDKKVLHSLDYSQEQPPSLASLVTEQSWLIFDKIGYGKGKLQWL